MTIKPSVAEANARRLAARADAAEANAATFLAAYQDAILYAEAARDALKARADAYSATLEGIARADPRIAKLLKGKTVIKTVIVPDRLVNFVVQ